MASAISYLLRRLTRYVGTLWVVTTITFVLFRLMPGDPTSMLVYGRFTEETRQAILRDFGLHRPMHEQYLFYIGNLLEGNMGRSFVHQEPVLDVLIPKLFNTLAISVPSLVVIMIGSYFMGSYLGWKKHEITEELGSYVLISLRSLPHFVLGLFLLIVFSFWLGWFPTGGMQSIFADTKPLSELIFTGGFYVHLLLPFLTFTFHFISDPTMLMRGNMLKERETDYSNLLELKGLREKDVRAHAAKNSMLPLITYIPTLISLAIGGVILIEVVYSWPGIGRELVNAVNNRDYPLAQGAFLIIAWVVITGNLVVDILYGYIDPRISFGGE